jgi:hypothetical protein
MSRPPPLAPRPAVLGLDVLPDCAPAAPDAPDCEPPVAPDAPDCAPPVVLDAPDCDAPDASELALPLLDEPPIRAFFRMKLPPLPDVALAPDWLLVDDVVVPVEPVELLEPALSRCRQPVAVISPALWVAELPVLGWPLCGDDVGDCAAARVPHSATAVLRPAAHCQ